MEEIDTSWWDVVILALILFVLLAITGWMMLDAMNSLVPTTTTTTIPARTGP